MNLIIVESPTKAKTLGRFLGSSFVSLATMGHIKDLPKSKLGVDLENNFEPSYQLVKNKEKVVSEIIKRAQKTSTIYIATDPDREGEAIASHVEEVLVNKSSKRNKNLHRVVFHEITKDAVEEAIKNPRDVDKNLVDAQIARRVLDRLVGYKLSPMLWKKVRRGLSAGRVQSVAVRLIVEKEEEIKAFIPVTYFDIYCLLKKLGGNKEEFSVLLVKKDGNKINVGKKEESEKIVDDLNKSKYVVSDIQKKEIVKNPVPPFTTSTLTQAASRLFYWSAKKTMSVAQKLYEEGFITYHRTDSVSVSKSAIDDVRKYIESKFGENYLPTTPYFYKTKTKVAQEAHEAIRPTKVEQVLNIEDSKFFKDAEKLYQLVWKRFVASQTNAAIFDETTILVEATKDNALYLLRTSGQIVKFDGWKKVWGNTTSINENEQMLPNLQKGEDLSLIKVDSQQKETQPPARYTEASLIKTLEKLGIGRPSTYAPIITTIQTRSYVVKEEGKFFPTTVGVAVNEFLEKNFPEIVDYDFSAEMENSLDEIAKGSAKWQEMMKTFYTPFDKKLIDVEKNSKRVKIETEKLGRKCPDCKVGELVVRIGRFGKFISCSRFPDCKYTEKFVQKIGVKCPDCGKGEVVVKITKKRRKFYGCSRYPDCKFASWKKPGEKVVETVDEKK